MRDLSASNLHQVAVVGAQIDWLYFGLCYSLPIPVVSRACVSTGEEGTVCIIGVVAARRFRSYHHAERAEAFYLYLAG